MTIEQEIFRRKKPDFDRLAAFGFAKDGDECRYAETFLDGAFRAEICVTLGGEVSGRGVETDTGEDFLPLRAAEHTGAFVGEVREQYRAILEKVAAACCIDQPFLHAQANRICALIARRHGEGPDFPFSGRHSAAAVFRHPDNRKWYGIIMSIPCGKLPPKPPGCGPSGLEALPPDAEIEVMNLKANPADIATLTREPGIFPCYHMNRKHWVSLALEDILPDERVMRLVEASREATRPRGAARPAPAAGATGPRHWLVPANPGYYDVGAAFAREKVILWKQGAGLRPGDVVYLYMAAPVSAILYKCEAVETDIPYDYADDAVKITKAMRIRLARRYGENGFPLREMRRCGVGPVRGARFAPPALVAALERE